jgi:transposase
MMQQRGFTKEFEEEAVRLVQTSGRTQREIAGDLGIGLSTLVRWIGRSRDRRASEPATAVASDVTAELKRLRRENEILRQAQFRRHGLVDRWVSISDLIIPMSFIRWVCVCLNQFHSGITYSENVIKNTRLLLINLFPLVCRDMTNSEKERIKSLTAIPSYLGGWG